MGQDAIEFVARALDVPLYRRVISGTAVVQDSEYGGRDSRERGGVDGDETEDLYALLAHVKVTQTLSMHFYPVKHVVCCSLNIPTRRVSLSVPYFRITSASASSMCECSPSGISSWAYSRLCTFSCQRLSLTPLSYLWQRDQAELLSEMIASGVEAVLIKVAGIGLTTKHLGKTLTEMQPTLTTLVGPLELFIAGDRNCPL